MISSRYALIVGLLLGLALVPTVIHSYYGLMDQDGLATAAVDAEFDGFQASPSLAYIFSKALLSYLFSYVSVAALHT